MILYGKQVLLYFLQNRRELIKKVYLSKEIDRDIFKKLTNIEILKVDTMKAQALCKGGNHQGFIFEIDDLEISSFEDLKTFSKLLILVGVSDMGNIGAIIRTAYCFGYDGVIVSEVASLKYDAIIRTSSGVAIEMPLAVFKNSKDLVNELKQVGFFTVASDAKGEDIRNISFDSHKKIALFVGSEGFGIPKKVIEKMDKVVAIKMEREFDSLNVSVATGILLDRIR